MTTVVNNQEKNKTIVQQLNDLYFISEWWQSRSESQAGITNYHQTMLDKGNIIFYVENNKMLGYCEFWRINHEQLGRILCHEEFIAPFENTTEGTICYVANCWIHPDHRGSHVYKSLRNRFFKLNCHCDYYCGQAFRKKTQPFKIFKKSELRSMLFKLGE